MNFNKANQEKEEPKPVLIDGSKLLRDYYNHLIDVRINDSFNLSSRFIRINAKIPDDKKRLQEDNIILQYETLMENRRKAIQEAAKVEVEVKEEKEEATENVIYVEDDEVNGLVDDISMLMIAPTNLYENIFSLLVRLGNLEFNDEPSVLFPDRHFVSVLIKHRGWVCFLSSGIYLYI